MEIPLRILSLLNKHNSKHQEKTNSGRHFDLLLLAKMMIISSVTVWSMKQAAQLQLSTTFAKHLFSGPEKISEACSA